MVTDLTPGALCPPTLTLPLGGISANLIIDFGEGVLI